MTPSNASAVSVRHNLDSILTQDGGGGGNSFAWEKILGKHATFCMDLSWMFLSNLCLESLILEMFRWTINMRSILITGDGDKDEDPLSDSQCEISLVSGAGRTI